MGTPIIASNIPPLKEVIEDKGILIDPTNQKQLTKAMHDIKNNRKKYQKDLIAQAKKYTWKNSAKKLVEFFSKNG